MTERPLCREASSKAASPVTANSVWCTKWIDHRVLAGPARAAAPGIPWRACGLVGDVPVSPSLHDRAAVLMPCLPAHVGRLRSGLLLPQDRNDLLFREPRSLHGPVTLAPDGGNAGGQVSDRNVEIHRSPASWTREGGQSPVDPELVSSAFARRELSSSHSSVSSLPYLASSRGRSVTTTPCASSSSGSSASSARPRQPPAALVGGITGANSSSNSSS